MRIYVIAAYPAVRAGLAAVARQQAEWRVVGEGSPASVATRLATAASGAAPAVQGDAPDVLIADLDGISDAEGVDAWLDTLRPRSGLLVIGPAEFDARRGPASGQATRLLASAARSAEDRGLAFGALRRDAMPEEIVAALSAVGSGLIALDRRLARDVFAPPERLPITATERQAGVGDETLTAREREVLQLMAEGLPNKLIANRLHITEHTAKFHVSAILTKLGAASRTEAVTLAAHRGLLVL